MSRLRRALGVLAVALAVGVVSSIVAEASARYPADEAYALKGGKLLGGDFLAFFVGGRIYRSERRELYDLSHQREVRSELLPESVDQRTGDLPFVYPPLVAALASPFSRLPFQQAFFAWATLGLVIGTGSLWLLARVSGAEAVVSLPVLLLFAFAFFPFLADAVLGGQIAWLGMLTMASVSAAVLAGRDGVAGAVMSLSYYKPPIFLLMLVVLCFARGRRFLLGFIFGVAILTTLSVVAVGPQGLMEYVMTVANYTYGQDVLPGVELPPEEGMGLFALAVTWSPSVEWAAIVLALPTLAVGYVAWKVLARDAHEKPLFGLMLCTTATAAFSIQFIKYDLALLLVPMMLGIGWIGRRGITAERCWVLAPFLPFYVEFAFRHLRFGSYEFNLASVCFIPTLLALVGYALVLNDTAEEEAPCLHPSSSAKSA